MEENALKYYAEAVEKKYNRYISFFEVSYDLENFKREIGTASGFYKKLTNSKKTLTGHGDNRTWWKKLQKPNGFYRYIISEDIITIKYVIESKKPVNEGELKLRIYKILRPIELEVYANSFETFIHKLTDVFEDIREGVETFGGLKKQHLKDFEALMEILN